MGSEARYHSTPYVPHPIPWRVQNDEKRGDHRGVVMRGVDEGNEVGRINSGPLIGDAGEED
jgi:hypothetical protein